MNKNDLKWLFYINISIGVMKVIGSHMAPEAGLLTEHLPLHIHIPQPVLHAQWSKFEGRNGGRCCFFWPGMTTACVLSFLLLHSSWNGFWFSFIPAQLGFFSITHGMVWVYLPHKHRTTENFPSLAWLELLRHERFAGEHLAICFPLSVSLTTWEWPSVRTHRDRSYSISSGLQC